MAYRALKRRVVTEQLNCYKGKYDFEFIVYSTYYFGIVPDYWRYLAGEVQWFWDDY